MSLEVITQQLFEAAQERKCCRLKFTGEPLERVIHPYGICRTSHNKIVIVCWQILGFSGKRNEPGFKNLILQNCERVEILEERFRVQEKFNPDDALYKEWVFHI